MTQTGPVSRSGDVIPAFACDGPAIRAGDENAPPNFLPDADPPEKIGALAGEYVGLFILGGLVLGLAAGALFPRRPVSKLGASKLGRGVSKGLGALAAVAGEAGLAVVEQARRRGGELREVNGRIGAGVAPASAPIGHEGDRTTARRLGALIDLLIARVRR